MRDLSQDIKAGVAVVTGAGAGLGRALAMVLATQDVRVAAIGRSREALDDTANAAAPGRVHPFVTDLADPDATARAFAAIRDTLGPPILLINNAAVYPRRDILDETPHSFMHTVAVNLGGPIACCHAVLPHMVEQGMGRIVNVVTFADIAPAPMAAAYSVSKGAQRILTRSLVADLGDRFPDIVITDWIPGALNTQMGLPDGIDPAQAARWGARLALMHDRSLNGMVFDQNRDYPPPKSFKRRLLERLLGQTPPAIWLE